MDTTARDVIESFSRGMCQPGGHAAWNTGMPGACAPGISLAFALPHFCLTSPSARTIVPHREIPWSGPSNQWLPICGWVATGRIDSRIQKGCGVFASVAFQAQIVRLFTKSGLHNCASANGFPQD